MWGKGAVIFLFPKNNHSSVLFLRAALSHCPTLWTTYTSGVFIIGLLFWHNYLDHNILDFLSNLFLHIIISNVSQLPPSLPLCLPPSFPPSIPSPPFLQHALNLSSHNQVGTVQGLSLSWLLHFKDIFAWVCRPHISDCRWNKRA